MQMYHSGTHIPFAIIIFDWSEFYNIYHWNSILNHGLFEMLHGEKIRKQTNKSGTANIMYVLSIILSLLISNYCGDLYPKKNIYLNYNIKIEVQITLSNSIFWPELLMVFFDLG